MDQAEEYPRNSNNQMTMPKKEIVWYSGRRAKFIIGLLRRPHLIKAREQGQKVGPEGSDQQKYVYLRVVYQSASVFYYISRLEVTSTGETCWKWYTKSTYGDSLAFQGNWGRGTFKLFNRLEWESSYRVVESLQQKEPKDRLLIIGMGHYSLQVYVRRLVVEHHRACARREAGNFGGHIGWNV